MMNRIDNCFKRLRNNKKKAFVAFISAGDPSLATTEKLALEFDRIGVDILELGVPFSDPLADGPTIQAASHRALKKGVSIKDVFFLVKRIRRKADIPIVLLTYYNIILHHGIARFVKEAVDCGVDAVVVPDLPPEEATDLLRPAKAKGLNTVFLLAPTSDQKRVREVSKRSTGFIYYVSLTGTTGVRRTLPKELLGKVRQVKRITRKPVCVGFGISRPEQAKAVAAVADGVIVGSAIVKVIEKRIGKKDLIVRTVSFVKKLRQSI